MKEKIQNERNEKILNKFSQFETHTILPFSQYLQEIDKDASIVLSGSYINNPHNLRESSDLDVLVFSQELQNPIKYVTALRKLKECSRNFESIEGSKTVFFTQLKLEKSFEWIGRTTNPDSTIMPCHFLYYGDYQNYFDREPNSLAGRLLANSKTISGSIPNIENIIGQKEDKMDNFRWDIERIVADFLLNTKHLPREFVVPLYVDNFVNAIRGIGDHLFDRSHDANFEKIIKLMFEEIYHFDDMVDIRKNGYSEKTVSSLIQPAIKIFNFIDRKKEERIKKITPKNNTVIFDNEGYVRGLIGK